MYPLYNILKLLGQCFCELSFISPKIFTSQMYFQWFWIVYLSGEVLALAFFLDRKLLSSNNNEKSFKLVGSERSWKHLWSSKDFQLICVLDSSLPYVYVEILSLHLYFFPELVRNYIIKITYTFIVFSLYAALHSCEICLYIDKWVRTCFVCWLFLTFFEVDQLFEMTTWSCSRQLSSFIFKECFFKFSWKLSYFWKIVINKAFFF